MITLVYVSMHVHAWVLVPRRPTQAWGRTELTLLISCLLWVRAPPMPWALHPYSHHQWDDLGLCFLALQPLGRSHKVIDSESSSRDTGSQTSQALPLRLPRGVVPDAFLYSVQSSLLTVWLKVVDTTKQSREQPQRGLMHGWVVWPRSSVGFREESKSCQGRCSTFYAGAENWKGERGTDCWGKEEVVMYSRRQRNEEFRWTDLKYL